MSGPVALADALPGTEERTTTCSCGQEFTQRRITWPSGKLAPWTPTSCPTCEAAERTNRGRAAAADLRAVRLRSLGVPPRYAAVSIETFELHGDEANRQRLNRLVIMARRFLCEWPTPAQELVVFRGGTGTGKGHLAWAIAKVLAAEAGAEVLVVKLPSLVRDLREGWRREGESEETRLRRYRHPDLLVVDEVSRHAFYGEPTQHLYDVLDHRMDYCRPTILTTNETEANFAQLVGPALLDRIIGYGGLVEFGDVSYRRRRLEER